MVQPSLEPTSRREDRFHPPGARAGRGQLEKFTRLVAHAIKAGTVVELDALGKFAARHSLQALSACPAGTRFQVFRLEDRDKQTEKEDADKNEEGDDAEGRAAGRQVWGVRLVACAGQSCEGEEAEEMRPAVPLLPVVAGTLVPVLAQRISLEVARAGFASAAVRADAVNGVGVLFDAILGAQGLGCWQPLRCTVRAGHGVGESRTRLLVAVHEETKAPKAFRAFPPGRDENEADPEVMQRFHRAVCQRLAGGQAVLMDCRGPHAVCGALLALGRVQGCTAELEVHWADSETTAEGDSKAASIQRRARALRIRAFRGMPWREFNDRDFSRTARLRVVETTPVQSLARAIGAEVLKAGGVAVHAYSDSLGAVSVAMKALALAPHQHGGQRFVCIPSLGRAAKSEEGGSGGVRSRALIRLFVRLRCDSGA